VAFGLGVAVTAVAGGLVATYYPFQPYVGLEFVISNSRFILKILYALCRQALSAHISCPRSRV